MEYCLSLQGCSKNQASSSSENQTVEPLKVEILNNSDSFKANEPNTFQIKVTQGSEAVSDAEEVVFQIWEKGNKDQSEMLKGKSDGKGVCSLEYSFDAPGTYEVIAHVTARDSHTMPQKEFSVK